MTNPVITEHDDIAPKPRSRYRRAIVLSVIAHVVLMLGLLFWYLPSAKQVKNADATSAQNTTSSNDPASRVPRFPESTRVPESTEDAGEIPKEEIEKSIQSQVEQFEDLPDQKKLSELEKNLRRLDSVATEESVVEVTTTIASTLGLDTDQYAKKEKPADGEFDTATAQLQDVTRSQGDSGEWTYESVLVDAEGRERTVPMTSAEGETVFQAFEQMKKFPLAEGIYRSVVMPMIQKTMVAQDVAQKAVLEAQRMQEMEQAKLAEEFREAELANPKQDSSD